ncbi:MAG: hypothetical protein V3W44_07165 [Dehalococcoidales bacterium]
MGHHTITAVKPRDNMVLYSDVCRRGKHSNTKVESCKFEIVAKDFCGGPGYNCTFIKVRRTEIEVVPAEHGDSGMGWYNGNTAYGIHKSSGTATGRFTAVNYLWDLDDGYGIWTGGI